MYKDNEKDFLYAQGSFISVLYQTLMGAVSNLTRGIPRWIFFFKNPAMCLFSIFLILDKSLSHSSWPSSKFQCTFVFDNAFRRPIDNYRPHPWKLNCQYRCLMNQLLLLLLPFDSSICGLFKQQGDAIMVSIDCLLIDTTSNWFIQYAVP